MRFWLPPVVLVGQPIHAGVDAALDLAPSQHLQSLHPAAVGKRDTAKPAVFVFQSGAHRGEEFFAVHFVDGL